MENYKPANSNQPAQDQQQKTVNTSNKIDSSTLDTLVTNQPDTHSYQNDKTSRPKRHNKKLLMLVITLFIVFIGSGLTVGYLFKNKSKKTINESSDNTTPTQAENSQPTEAVPPYTLIDPESTAAIKLDKAHTIIGEGPKTILDCPNHEDYPFILSHSDIVIANMTIRNCKYGLKIINDDEQPVENLLIYNVIFDNNALAGIYIENTNPEQPISFNITNNTFVGGQAGIVINSTNSGVESEVENNIFYNNLIAPINITSQNDGGVKYSYNLFFGCKDGCKNSWYSGTLHNSSSPSENMFDSDPQFTNVAERDFSLSPDSPAIDAGDPGLFEPALIFDGNGDGVPRLDIGAIEYSKENQ